MSLKEKDCKSTKLLCGTTVALLEVVAFLNHCFFVFINEPGYAFQMHEMI